MGKLRFRDESEDREDYLILSRKAQRKQISIVYYYICSIYVLNGYQLSHKNNNVIMYFVWNTFILLYMQGKLLHFSIQHLILYYLKLFCKIKYGIGDLQYS